MKLFVLDTHVYVAYAQGNMKYFSQIVKIFFRLSENNECIFYIPTIVFWEIGYKAFTGDLRIKDHSPEESAKLMHRPLDTQSNFRDLPLSRKAASLAPTFSSKLPDPFDQLIVASALDANLPLITKDLNIQKSKIIQTVW